MKKICCSLGILCLLFGAAMITARADETKSPDQKIIDQVKQGKLDKAPVSAWGFDPVDSTQQFQAAINSGVKTLIVDRQSSPWIVKPLKLKSNLELVFEEGCEVQAKKGEFHGLADSLFIISLVDNVVMRGLGQGANLRMWKADYHTDAYKKSEWRHGINIKSSSNIRIENLSIIDSGGDGIYLGIAKRTVHNEHIVIKNVVCDGNNRQGISVIDAVDMLIEDTIMKNTWGTAPQAGIDFEPNHESEAVRGCIMRNCICENNKGSGYDFYLPNLATCSGPLEITLENCISRNNERPSIAMTLPNGPTKTIQGFIKFKNCIFENDLGGIMLQGSSTQGAKISFENTRMVWNMKNRENVKPSKVVHTPILLQARADNTDQSGNIDFGDFSLEYDTDVPAIMFNDNAMSGLGLKKVTGNFTISQAGKKSTLVLDDAWCTKNYPVTMTRKMPIVDTTKMQFEPLDKQGPKTPADSKKAPSLLRVRHKATWLCYAEKGETVNVSLRMLQVGRSDPSEQPIEVIDPNGKKFKRFNINPTFKADTDISWKAPATGIYQILTSVGSHSISVTKSNVAIACQSFPSLALVSSRGKYFFYVPEGTKEFGVKIVGTGEERVKVKLSDPSGKEVWNQDNISTVSAYFSEEGKTPAAGIWAIEFARPSQGVLEDFSVSLMGVPSLVSNCPKLILVEKK